MLHATGVGYIGALAYMAIVILIYCILVKRGKK